MSKRNFRWAAVWVTVFSLLCSSFAGAELVDLAGSETQAETDAETAENEYTLPQIDPAVVAGAEETLTGEITEEIEAMGDAGNSHGDRFLDSTSASRG